MYNLCINMHSSGFFFSESVYC